MISVRSQAELLRGVEPILAEWTDEVVPATVELMPHHQYSPRYAWMYAYEKRLKYRIEDVLGRRLGAVERVLFGADGVLSEGLSNAFVHGHRRDPNRAIRVTCRVGAAALLLSIQDNGKGFDVARVMAKLQAGGSYFHMAGNGLRALARTPGVVAAYNNGGRMLHLRVPLVHEGKG